MGVGDRLMMGEGPGGRRWRGGWVDQLPAFKMYLLYKFQKFVLQNPTEYKPLPPMTKKLPVVKAPIRNCGKNAPSFVLK